MSIESLKQRIQLISRYANHQFFGEHVSRLYAGLLATRGQ